jgi:hypothetical protein
MFVCGESAALNRFARVVQAFFLDSPRPIELFKGFHLPPALFPKRGARPMESSW